MAFGRRAALAALAGIGMAGRARAQEAFPRQAIRMILPVAAGSGSDILARMVAHGMRHSLSQPVVVENRPGGGGVTGTEAGARAAPDGHTIVFGTTSSLGVNAAMNPHAGYVVARDFAPLAGVARSYYVICTTEAPDRPRTLAELVDRLRKGDETFATGGTGTIGHLSQELFLRRAGVTATQIPYRGSAAALTDLAGGRVLFGCDTLAVVMPFLQSGRLRPLAVTAPRRVEGLPHVPTTGEAGVPNLVTDAWFGIVTQAAVPAPVRAQLTGAILKSVALPETRAQFDTLAVEAMPLPPDEFGRLMRESTEFWVGFLRESGIRIQY